MENFDSLLFKDSPFLPPASQESLIQIGTDITKHRLPNLVAVAKEVGLIGTAQNDLHQQEFDWISKSFKVTMQNLDDFMLGFITPPTLILGAFALKIHGVYEALKLYCPPTEDLNLVRHNIYKSYHLFPAFNIVNSAIERHPLVGATPIYRLCQDMPFKIDFHYSAGIEASKILFTELTSLLFPA